MKLYNNLCLISTIQHTRNIDSKEIDIREKLKEMLQCEKYNELIKKGAEKIRKW